MTSKVSASERNASALAISQRTQPKLNNRIVKGEATCKNMYKFCIIS